ncbi:MAG: response regulator [Cyanobacteria bacterium TGS_CYA1]|nr:response regulator [Cyanobacteria bacterium TGS_CYA1]
MTELLFKHKILVVDDEEANLRLLQRVLRSERNYEVLTAVNAQEGLARVKENDVSLIITDQRMPGMTGVELLRASLNVNEDCIKILLTGYTDLEALIDAINEGHIYKYITKPWDAEELKLTVRRALEAYELKQHNTALVAELKEAMAEMELLSLGTIRALADALDAKCDYTAGHSLRVSQIAVLIGRAMKLSPDELRDIELGGILHDIGKIGVPESILWKPGKLNPEEKEMMSKHPEISAQIIGDLKGLKRAREYVRHHHEFFDGTGYPDHLKGDDIPLGARIILVSDAYDAMTTDRPYRKAVGHEGAIIELKKLKGTQFDPKVVDAFLSIGEESASAINDMIKKEFSNSFLGWHWDATPVFEAEKTGKKYKEYLELKEISASEKSS